MRLQTARQARNESPQEFADRCRTLSQKIVWKVDDPVVQRIHNENADRMLLASFVAGLTGVPGTQKILKSRIFSNSLPIVSTGRTRHNNKYEDYDHFFKTLGNRFLVGGDFNAKHNFWGSRLTNTKGRELLNVLQYNIQYISTR